MVCTLGRGRMATMARLLTVRTSLEITSEEVTEERSAVQTINWEFSQANEPNLLEEEDMHVFDSRPLADSLLLVRCNACKKPIKTSQFAAHAEHCGLLNILEDTATGLAGDSDHKKSPIQKRTKRHKLSDNSRAVVGEQGKSESANRNAVAGSKSDFDCKSGCISLTWKAKKNGPVPLATKIYHSQGNHLLRQSLGYLYREASGEVRDHCSRSPELIQDNNILHSKIPSSCKLMHVINKDDTPEKILAQSSELCGGVSGSLPPAINCSNTLSKPGLQVATNMGIMKDRFHSAPYSFSGTTGTALGTMQQVS